MILVALLFLIQDPVINTSTLLRVGCLKGPTHFTGKSLCGSWFDLDDDGYVTLRDYSLLLE